VKCIFCRICEERLAILDRKQLEWLEAQSNNVALMERETDPQLVYRAHDLIQADPAEGFKQYLALAESRSVWSMATVGKLLESGEGTDRDLARAEEWLLRAHRAGSDYALIWLGMLHLKSDRHESAQDIFRTGVDRGFAPAMFYLVWSYWKCGDRLPRRDEALSLLQRGSAAGDLTAQRFLVTSMLRGRFGLRHVPAGFRLLSKVADDEAKIIEDDQRTMQGVGDKRLGFLGRLAASFWTSSRAKISGASEAHRASLLSTSS
jgi:hypothetical protein